MTMDIENPGVRRDRRKMSLVVSGIFKEGKMSRRTHFISLALILLLCGFAAAQMTPWLYWTLLPKEQMDMIIGEASGETAWNTIMETGGYNKDRLEEEYAGTFYEVEYVYSQLKHYGLPVSDVAISQRAALSHALIDGRAVAEFDADGKAAREIARLWDTIKEDGRPTPARAP